MIELFEWSTGSYSKSTSSAEMAILNKESVLRTLDSIKKTIVKDVALTGYFTKNNFVVGDKISIQVVIGGTIGKGYLNVANFRYASNITFYVMLQSILEIHGSEGYTRKNLDYRFFADSANLIVTYTLTEEDTENNYHNEGTNLPLLPNPLLEKIKKYTDLYGEYVIKRNMLQKMIQEQMLNKGYDIKIVEDKVEEEIEFNGSRIKIFTSCSWRCFIYKISNPLNNGDFKTRYYVGYIGSDTNV